jgi:hypothetical protein
LLEKSLTLKSVTSYYITESFWFHLNCFSTLPGIFGPKKLTEKSEKFIRVLGNFVQYFCTTFDVLLDNLVKNRILIDFWENC